MTSDYQPIDCDQHSILEVLAMRRSRVMLDARVEGGAGATYTGLVVDVLARSGAEYLVLESVSGQAGATLSIRLDRLLEIRDMDGVTVWRQQSDDRG
jgi:transcriptional antiterminator Rof (Rho-off)